MDSTPTVPVAAPPAERAALARLGRVLPAARGIVRFAYRAAAVSAACAFVLGVAAFVARPVSAAQALVLALVLTVPAGALAFVGWTLSDLLRLPASLREAAVSATREAADGFRGGRATGVLSAVWAARGLVLGSRDAWLRTAALARLASLPLVLGALALCALNAVVVPAGLAALAWLVLR